MKTILTITLAVLLFAQGLVKTYILVSYEVNKAEIARTLCENRNKPKMHCNGKCHLKKQLDEQERREAPAAPNFSENSEVIFCNIFHTAIPVPATSDFSHSGLVPDHRPLLLSGDIFHPPSC